MWGELEGGMTFKPGIYRTYASTYQAILAENELYLWDEGETVLFKRLGRNGLIPGYLALEITGYPMGWLAAILPQNVPSVYSAFSITGNWNLLASMGSGFQEPWSVSLFAGDFATFWELDTTYTLVPVASGVSGWVLTASSQELVSGQLVHQSWMRLEWKIKGETRGTYPIGWDIKLGYRWEENPKRPDGFTIQFSWENFSNLQSRWAGNHNVDVRLRWATGPTIKGPMELKVVMGKAFTWRQYQFGLNLGIDRSVDYLEPTDQPPEGRTSNQWIIQPFIIWH